MTTTSEIEFKGLIAKHPVDELLVEFSQNELTGSLRLSAGKKKSIVYLEKGEVVFVVSNQRDHRLFEILIDSKKIEKKQLAGIDEFTNDMHLAKVLVDRGDLSQDEIHSVFDVQFQTIISEAFKWKGGDFIFSASARIKSDLRFSFDIRTLILENLASMDPKIKLGRIGNIDEMLELSTEANLMGQDLSPEEGFILSRLGTDPLKIDSLLSITGISPTVLLPVLYSMWVAGIVKRVSRVSAIGLEDTERLSGKQFELKKSARSFEDERAAAALEAEKAEKIAKEQAQKMEDAKRELTLGEYLKKVETAATHYEIFGVSPDAKLSAIKSSYFAMAKKFHPDLFSRTGNKSTQSRIENAFTEIAQAYETLKDEESREVYDFKLRKAIEQLRVFEEGELSEVTEEELKLAGEENMAQSSFDTGYDLLLNDEIEKATPLLARAAKIDKKNARFRAFYGRALSFDAKSHRLAEAELQEAIRLEPKNSHYHLMLAELFIEIGLKVRATGELTRLLKIEPENKEAQNLLDTLED